MLKAILTPPRCLLEQLSFGAYIRRNHRAHAYLVAQKGRELHPNLPASTGHQDFSACPVFDQVPAKATRVLPPHPALARQAWSVLRAKV